MLPNCQKRRFEKGIVDPLSLISLGFLVVTLLVGTAAVSNPEMAFDLRESAKEIGDEVVKTVTTSTKKASGASCGKGSDCKSGSCIRGICAGSSTSATKKDNDKKDEKKSTPSPAKTNTSTTTKSTGSDSEEVEKYKKKQGTSSTTTKKDETTKAVNTSGQTPDPVPTLPPVDKDRFGYIPTEEEKKTGPSYYSGDKGCKDGLGFVSGTYCTPTGERRLVGKAATQVAYNKHVEAATQIYANMSNQQLLDYAKTNKLADCKSGDTACEQDAITKAEEKKLNELVIIEGTDRTTLKDMRKVKEAVVQEIASAEKKVVEPTPTPDNKLVNIYNAAIDPTTSYQDIKRMFCENEPDKAGCMREAIDEKVARENLIALLPEQYRQETKNTYKQNSVIFDYANPGVTDTDLKKKYCGGVAVCEQYFSRDMILANLTEENKKIAVESFQTNFSNPNVITQFINQYDKGDTSNLTTVNKVLQLNKDAEEAFYAYKAEIAKNNPLVYIKMTDEEIAKGFYNNVYQDPVKLQAYSKTYKEDPQAFSYYTRQFGTDTKAEVNAGIVGYVNQLIETTPVPGLTDENGKLKDINTVAPEMKQKAYDLVKEEYMATCIKNGGRNTCEQAFNYNNAGNLAVQAKLAQNPQYYLNQVLLQERGTAKLSASFSNLATVNNLSISQKLREEALKKAKEMLMDPSRTDLSFYSGPIRDSVVSQDEAINDRSLLDQVRKTTTVTSAGGNRVVTTMNILTIDENDPKTQALIEQLANEYLERQLVEESYTRGAGLSGALVAGGLGASAGAAGCVASGIGAVASPICGVVGGIVGGISGAVSNFIPVWGNATSEEIAQEKEWITSKVGNSDIAGSIAQGFYSSQGAVSINPTTGAMQVGRSSSARNNQFALLDTLINPTANLSFDSQIQMAPQVLDKWEERMEIEQKQAMDNIVIAGASGGLFAGAGGQVARTVMAGTRSIAISQGSEALAQTVVGFGLNLAQNGVQFSQNQGNFDLLSTPAQIELKDCRNKGLDCSDLEDQAMQERNQAFTQTMAISTIMDTMMNTQQGIIAYKNQSAAINSVQTKLTQGLPLTTAEFKILADLGFKNNTDIKIEPVPIDTNPVKIAQPEPDKPKPIVEVKPVEEKPIVEIPPEIKPEEPNIGIKPETENPVTVKTDTDLPEQNKPVITVAPTKPVPTVRPTSPITITVKKVTDSVNNFVKRVFTPPVRDTGTTTKIVDTTTTKEADVKVSEEIVPDTQKTETDTGRAPPEEQKGPEVPNELLPTISIAPIERAVNKEVTSPQNMKAALELETLTPKPGIDYKTGRFNPIELVKNVFGLGFRGETRKLKYAIENGKITPEQARVKANEISVKYLSSEDLSLTYIKSVDLLLDQQAKLSENTPLTKEFPVEAPIKEIVPVEVPTSAPLIPEEIDLNPINKSPNDLSEVDKEFFDQIPGNNNQNPFTRSIASDPTYKPVKKVEIDGKKFYVSQVLANGKYKYAIMYAQEPSTGLYLPRVLYKSNSDGVWRSSPGFDFSSGTYSKGNGYHYTQETKLNFEIAKILDSSDTPSIPYGGDIIKDRFALGLVAEQGALTFSAESGRYNDGGQLKDIQKYRPGSGLLDNPAEIVKDFGKVRYPRDFVPDFSKGPTKTEVGYHSLLGDVTYEFFEGKLSNRPTEWIMARDGSGRVWIDSIYFKDGKVNSYGTQEEIIDSGALTNKPLEYRKYSEPLVELGIITGFNSKYNDITPLLANLKPIADYKASIASRKPSTDVAITPKTDTSTPNVIKTAQNALGNARKVVITGIAVTITTAGLWLGINTANITPKIPDVVNVRPPAAEVVVSPKQEFNLNLEKSVVENMIKPEIKEEVAIAPEPVFELTKTSDDFVTSLSGFADKDVINVVPSLSYTDPEGNEFSVKVTGKAYKNDVETFDGAVKLLSPLSEYMNAEIELYRVSNGDLGNKIYGEASSWVENGELQTRVSYTNEYTTESHLLTKRSGIPESAFTKGTVDEASFIHEFVHTMKLDLKDGKYQTSDLLTQYMNIFYKGEVTIGDQLIEYNPKDVLNEKAPTKYSQSYAKGEQQRAASEDMADAIALYLTAPEWLKEHNPVRYAFVDFVVKGGDPLSFSPVEVNMLGQAVVKDTFEPIAYLPLGGSDFGKAVAATVASIDGSKAPKGTSYDSGRVSLTESDTVIEYIAPTDLVSGSSPDGCSNCSILARAIKENVNTVQTQIDELLREGKVNEAIDLVESLDKRFSHDMTNQVMETGFEAQVQILRVTADPNTAEQQLAVRKLDDAIEAGEIDLALITDPEEFFKTRSYIDSLIIQKREIETLITNQATILERLAVYTRETVDTFQTLLGSRKDFVINEEEVDWKLKELATDPYIVEIDIPDSNVVKTTFKKPLLPDSVFKEDALYVNEYLDIMENYLYLPLIEDTFTAQDHVIEGQISRSDWQNEWKAQIEAKYGQEKALEMFAFLKRTQFNRNRIAQILSAFADMDYMEIGITTPRGKAIYTDLMDTYFSGNPLKNYDGATAAEKREVVDKVKELIKETFAGIEAKQ